MCSYLVLGYFGHITNQLDGQTVKTRDLYRLVKHQKQNVSYYDTQEFKYNKLSILRMFWLVIKCDCLIYLPAHNNLKVIFPIIFLLSKFFGVRIHYFVVGGWLREFLEDLPLHRFMLKRINGIHTETTRMKNELQEFYQFKNVDVFPNFRFFDFEPNRLPCDKLRLVFMARVNKLKGLDWIFNLAQYIKEHDLDDQISITFYGPILDNEREYFESVVDKYHFVDYKGVLQPSVIHQTLNEYDLMLLPTHYFTEGLPGSIVDAYISGIPVIATEWKHSREFIDDGYSGFIIPFENGEMSLIEKVLLLNRDRKLLKQMQINALEKRKEFIPPLLEQYID